MNRYEITFEDAVVTNNRLEVEADKFSFQADAQVAYFYNKGCESPEAVAARVTHVRRVSGVKYFLDISDELANDPDFGTGVGIRILMKTRLVGDWKLKGTQLDGISRYLIEDENAPAEVEGHLIEIECRQEVVGKNQVRQWISDWKVLE